MKRKLIIITLVALLASACSINLQPSGSYVDDLYYWPGDVTPALTASDMETLSGKKPQQNKELIVVSELKENQDGSSTLNNYIYADDEPDWFGQVQAYNLENLNSESQDTIYFETEEDETVYINNYYVDDEYSYSSRIRRFHNPYYFDNDPYWNLSMSWGYYSPYSWNRPYYSGYGYWDPWYSSWYSPWGYYGGYSSLYWGYGYYPYYSYYHGYPYYYGYPYYHNQHNHYTYRDYYDGERRSSRPNTTYSGGGTARNVANADNTRGGSPVTVNKSLNPDNRRSVGATNELANSQKSGTVNSQNNREVLTEKRRSTEGKQTTVTRNAPVTQQAANGAPSYRTRTGENNSPVRTTPGTTVNGATNNNRSYTPSYNTPRSNTRATYNSSNKSVPGTYQSTDRDRSSSGSSSKSGYAIPSTSSRSSYQSGSNSPAKSYSSGNSSSPASKSPSSYSSGNRSYTPSAPARSGSSYSGSSNRSTGSSYSSGSTRSSGSSYSGGSSGSSLGSSSSSSGNRR